MSHEMMHAAIFHKYTALAVEKIRKMVAVGLSARELLAMNEDGWFGFGRRIRTELLNARERAMNFGRGQVNDELKRQEGSQDATDTATT